MAQKSLIVTKVRANPCLVCNLAAGFLIAYRDYNNRPPTLAKGQKIFVPPNDQAYACDNHVGEVTAIVLKRNKLADL
jgi:hypothetical protein